MERCVMVAMLSGFFIILGIVSLVVALRALEEKHELAITLACRGGWCIAIGVTIALVFWLIRWLKNTV